MARPRELLSLVSIAYEIPSEGEGRNTRYLSLRWDVKRNMALKLQYDVTKDKSDYSYPFFGDSKLLSVSLQGVF